jgi:hypothetical protein
MEKKTTAINNNENSLKQREPLEMDGTDFNIEALTVMSSEKKPMFP